MRAKDTNIINDPFADIKFNVDWKTDQSQNQAYGVPSKVALMVLLLLIRQCSHICYVSAACSGAHMLLLWDPANGTPPSPWSVDSTHDGYFIRGDTPANFGVEVDAPGRPYTPTTNGAMAVGAGAGSGAANGGSGAASTAAHVHTAPLVTYTAENNGDNASNPNLPAFRSLQLIKHDPAAGSCIPNVIPDKAIAFFTTLTSVWVDIDIRCQRSVLSIRRYDKQYSRQWRWRYRLHRCRDQGLGGC